MWRIALIVTVLCSTANAGKIKSLVELSDGKVTVRGRIEALDRVTCTMMGQDGRLHLLERKKLKSPKRILSRFRALTAPQLKPLLLKELGDGFEIKTTRNYLVCQPKGRGKNYAKIFEDVYRSFHYQFRRRDYRLARPEFPLVAIVFPTFGEFARYAAKDGMKATPMVRGYYHRFSNRVAVWDDPRVAVRPNPESDNTDTSLHAMRDTERGVESTIVHETIHQVAFNTGIHPRLGEAPRWLVEGLAMTFQTPGFRDNSTHGDPSRINRSRLKWFRTYQEKRRPEKSLADFVTSESFFQKNVLDSYSQAWALTFFFMDQPVRSQKFSRYVRAMAKRDTRRAYSAAERLKDFEAAFGDIDGVEVKFLRFMNRLDADSAVASR